MPSKYLAGMEVRGNLLPGHRAHTDKVSVNWLWIDCLCIIQYFQEDWLHEAGMMSQIYQNAQLNISPDIGAASRAGCFAERDVIDITPLRISCPQISKTWMVLPTVL